MRRRALLTTLGAFGSAGLAGCSNLSNDDPPAGSLRFENEDDLPHVIRVAVHRRPTCGISGRSV